MAKALAQELARRNMWLGIRSNLTRPYHRHGRSGSSSSPPSSASDDGSDDEHGLTSSLMQEGGKVKDKESGKWTQQLAWLTGILEPALNLYRRAMPPGNSGGSGPPSTRSLVDIAASLQRSNYGMQQWTLGELTLGLYLLSIKHESEMATDTLDADQVVSDHVVQEWIYHVELAKGAYMKNAAALARVSMLRESNVLKFVDKASILRPAYYIGLDHRSKLVILGIRGTQSIHDLITDLASHSEEVAFDVGNVHYGTLESAKWFLYHEVPTLKRCLHEHVGYGLCLVGHSLGGATATLLAIMLHKDSTELLGIDRDQISAVGIGTPPCVSKSIAIECASYISTLVFQDDVIPRMSSASLVRLRNEITTLDWSNILMEEENRHGVLDLVASTFEAISSIQDVARRYATYAKLRNGTKSPSDPSELDVKLPEEDKEAMKSTAVGNRQNIKTTSTFAKQHQIGFIQENTTETKQIEELFAPGTLFHLRRQSCGKSEDNKDATAIETCSLWKGHLSSRLQRIVLSGSMVSDHKCDNHYYGLRDALKGLPKSGS